MFVSYFLFIYLVIVRSVVWWLILFKWRWRNINVFFCWFSFNSFVSFVFIPAGLNGAELNGKEAAGDLLQLSRDNIILAVSKGASRSVADELNKQHMIIQNRFRCHLGTKVLPELISTINQSTSSSADLLPDIPVITIDFKKFVDDLKYMLGHNNESKNYWNIF